MSRLLVVIPGRLSGIVAKGEVVPRYYNPQNVFSEVHILATTDDDVDSSLVQPMVGSADLHIHYQPVPQAMFLKTLGWRPWLLSRWAEPAEELGSRINPDVIRAYGEHVSGFLAHRIAKRTGAPYLVSIHHQPDEDKRANAKDLRQWVSFQALRSVEKRVLWGADLVLPVYEAIVPYLDRIGVSNFEVTYNVINGAHLEPKEDYQLSDPVRIIGVGRQFEQKDPTQLVQAIGKLEDVELTLVGDGPLHEKLRRTARQADVMDRVRFLKAVPNDKLCRSLHTYDVFATHCEMWGIPKTVMEATIVGLPTIVNRRTGDPVPEFEGGHVRLVENTPEGYAEALRELAADRDKRRRLGHAGRAYAEDHWEPTRAEEIHAQRYQSFTQEVD